MTQTFTAIVHREDNLLHGAECSETGTASQGETISTQDTIQTAGSIFERTPRNAAPLNNTWAYKTAIMKLSYFLWASIFLAGCTTPKDPPIRPQPRIAQSAQATNPANATLGEFEAAVGIVLNQLTNGVNNSNIKQK